jgi:hypothetical protein
LSIPSPSSMTEMRRKPPSWTVTVIEGGMRINRVVYEFPDDGSWSFNYFPRGDPLGYDRV